MQGRRIFFENHVFWHEKTIFTVTKQKWGLARFQRAIVLAIDNDSISPSPLRYPPKATG